MASAAQVVMWLILAVQMVLVVAVVLIVRQDKNISGGHKEV